MTTDDLDRATRAAFAARYAARPWHQFGRQPLPVQLRWTQTVARALNRQITNGRQFREAYIDGLYANPADVKMWSEIGARERTSWQSTYDAAMHAAFGSERVAA